MRLDVGHPTPCLRAEESTQKLVVGPSGKGCETSLGRVELLCCRLWWIRGERIKVGQLGCCEGACELPVGNDESEKTRVRARDGTDQR